MSISIDKLGDVLEDVMNRVSVLEANSVDSIDPGTWLSRREVAEMIKQSTQSVRKLEIQGMLKNVNPSSSHARYLYGDVKKFMSGC